MRHWRVGYAMAAALASTLTMGTAAFGQSDDERAAARTAATSGAQALEAGRYEEALELFRRAEAIIHAPPHLLYMARAQAKLGRLVSANETYLKIVREPVDPAAPRAFTEAHASAVAEVAQLAPRIPTLKVEVEGAAEGEVSLTIDGAPASSAMIGLARPIDPGTHELQAKAPHAVSDVVSVTLTEGMTQATKLVLHPIAVAVATPQDHAPIVAAPPEQGSRVPAFVALGVGAAGMVVGTVFMLQNRSKRDDADALCPLNTCPTSRKTEVQGLDDDANSAATMSWIGYGVGVVGLGVGAVLLLLNGRATTPTTTGTTTVRVRPWVGAGAAGLVGAF